MLIYSPQSNTLGNAPCPCGGKLAETRNRRAFSLHPLFYGDLLTLQFINFNTKVPITQIKASARRVSKPLPQFFEVFS